MLGENIKQLRKQRGLTQEELAIRLHVVRQTVSKWEKSLSVPDAEMLQRISEVLDTSVSELLGEPIRPEHDRNELAEQLSRINEQLAIRNRRFRRIWRIIGVVLIVIVALSVFLIISGVTNFSRKGIEYTISMYDDNPTYSEKEVEEAFTVVEKYFKQNFKGCTLESLSYDEDYSLEESEEWMKQYAADEVIVLMSGFTTDARGGDGSLDSNSTYEDWKWVLTRSNGGPWTLQTWG